MRQVKRWLEIILSITGITWLGWFLFTNRAELLQSLGAMATRDLFTLIALVLVGWVAMGAQNVVLMRSQRVHMGLGESVLVHSSTSLLNYVPTRLGTLFRFRYLKQVHGLDYKRNLGLISLRMGILLAISAAMAVAGILWLGGEQGMRDAFIALVLFSGAGAASILFLSRVAPIEKAGRISEVWNGFAAAIMEARSHKRRLAAIAALIVFQLALAALRMDVAFDIIGTPVDLAVLLVVAPVVVLLSLFSFATLGIREAIVGGLVAATGLDFSAGVIAASAERAALMLLSFTLGAIGTLAMMWRMKGRAPQW